MIVRYAISSGLAFGVAFGLFFLMQALVAMGDATLDKSEEMRVVDFVRVKRSSPIQEKERELPNRPKDTDAPPTPNLNLSTPDVGGPVSAGPMAISAPTADVPLKMRQGPKLGPPPVADSGATPLVRLQPEMPLRARQDGIEGYARVQFDVDPNGRVRNVKVLDAQPRGIFEQSAIRTIKKWRYRAKVASGERVWDRGKVIKLNFTIN